MGCCEGGGDIGGGAEGVGGGAGKKGKGLWVEAVALWFGVSVESRWFIRIEPGGWSRERTRLGLGEMIKGTSLHTRAGTDARRF